MFSLGRRRPPTCVYMLTQQILNIVERFLHIEAMSGVVLLIAAAGAFFWANSSFHESYDALWHAPLSFSLARYNLSWDLRFWVNDILMTAFFLVAGMEIRCEIYDGALSDLKQAILPVVAAAGGICFPAIIYIALNADPARHSGWAIPTATDIAFAIGILALLGRSIPSNVRIMLLSLAIIDDVIAIVIIAFFYSNEFDPSGLFIASSGIGLVLLMQWLGLGTIWVYTIPGVVLWIGLLKIGAHPSLAGVVLGLLTPVLPAHTSELSLKRIMKAVKAIQRQPDNKKPNINVINHALRDMISPVMRVQIALRPWVAFGIMPIFVFANTGIHLDDINFSGKGASFVLVGVAFGLIVGKPTGILLASFVAVKAGFCRLPPNVSWGGMVLVGLLAGIGFTMAIFLTVITFDKVVYLSSIAKIGVLLGSTISGIIGLVYGFFYVRQFKRSVN
ncbi:MAG: Na+:H+ antiporter [Candidatus Tokpelaia sp. JSC189]|nr:MAG: Na+:H+ antiporter [Candidatus Tokpelaia sp. JSC189]